MSQLGAIAWAKARIALHTTASVRTESKLKVSVVSISALLLWVGAFAGFYAGLAWLRDFDIIKGVDALTIGQIVMVRVLAMFSLALFVMLIFSNILVFYSTAYRSREAAWMHQTPLPVERFFIARFAETAIYSSWATAFLGAPLVLAYGLVTKANPFFYAASLLFFVPFVILPAAIGACMAMILVHLYPRLPRILAILAAILILAVAYHYFRGIIDTVREVEEASGSTAAGVSAVLNATAQAQSPWLPSHWAARGLFAAAEGRWRQSLFDLSLLTANALFVTWLGVLLARRILHAGWSGLQGLGRVRRFPHGKGMTGWIDKTLQTVLPEPIRSLTAKDAKLFFRDASQWSQFAVFFGIMAIYLANARKSDFGGYDAYKSWVAAMNFGTCTLILATLTTRFVYPLISLEGRRFWILGLAPLTMRRLMWQKFWLSVASSSFFTVGLIVLSCIRLEIEPIPFALALYSIIATNFALSGLAVGLGALYPNFEEDNPARIVSGMGGTLNFLISMAIVCLVIAAQVVVLQWRYIGHYTSPAAFWFALAGAALFIAILTATATLLPMRAGIHSLENAEF